MTRGVALSIVGSVALIALAGCGHSWFEERAPWRRDAEVECLRSSAVKEGPAITALPPIDGPGMCGADFPLRVAALGTGEVLGFADDPRPPGLIPQDPGVAPASAAWPAYPARSPFPVTPEPPGAPMAISPPVGDESPVNGTVPSDPPGYGAAPRPLDPSPPVPAAVVPLGPPRAPVAMVDTASVTPPATLACPIVSALDTWVSNGIQPAAMRWFGQPVIDIRQISSYSCRPMNGQRGAPISEHAFGNALDVAAFTLADGRNVTVVDGWHGPPAERAFLHDVQASACRLFTTVLAPGSNVFHYNHIHVDLARHAGGRRICQPSPIPGELMARGESAATGALDVRRASPPWAASGRWQGEGRSDLAPGED